MIPVAEGVCEVCGRRASVRDRAHHYYCLRHQPPLELPVGVDAPGPLSALDKTLIYGRKRAIEEHRWVDLLKRGKKVLGITPEGDVYEIQARPLMVKLGEYVAEQAFSGSAPAIAMGRAFMQRKAA